MKEGPSTLTLCLDQSDWVIILICSRDQSHKEAICSSIATSINQMHPLSEHYSYGSLV